MTPRRIFFALAVLFLLAYTVGIEALRKPDSRIVSGDAVYYYVYLRSAVFDHDLQFENDYLRLYGVDRGDPGMRENFRPTPTGHVSNSMSVGPAIVWSPLFLLLAGVLRAAGAPVDGFDRALQASAGYSGILAAIVGVYLSFRLCWLWFDERIAIWSSIAIWLGSSALYYTMVSPTYSHAPSILAVSAFFLYWAKTRGDRSYRRFALLGALGGFAALVRWQDAVFLLVPALDALELDEPGKDRSWTKVLGRWVATGVAAVLVFTPQIVVWQILYGRPLTIPQGDDWMQWGSPHFYSVLFSNRRGLFTWTPIVLPAVVGLFLFLRDRPAIARMLVAAFLVSVYANAAVSQWWAGAAFGARRFVSCFPLFVVGLAAVFERVKPSLVPIVAIVFIGLNALLMFQFVLFMHHVPIAPKPDDFYDLWISRFVVPFRALDRMLE